MKIKLCWFCTHFIYGQAMGGYSEYTPGSDFYIECDKKHWKFDAEMTTQAQFGEMLSTAKTCEDFVWIQGLGGSK